MNFLHAIIQARTPIGQDAIDVGCTAVVIDKLKINLSRVFASVIADFRASLPFAGG